MGERGALLFTPVRKRCSACAPDRASSLPVGLTCIACGRHFHVGRVLLALPEEIGCPSCGVCCLPYQIQESRVSRTGGRV